MIPILQTRKLRLGEARTVTHAHGSRRPACGPTRGSEGTGPAWLPLPEPPRGARPPRLLTGGCRSAGCAAASWWLSA